MSSVQISLAGKALLGNQSAANKVAAALVNMQNKAALSTVTPSVSANESEDTLSGAIAADSFVHTKTTHAGVANDSQNIQGSQVESGVNRSASDDLFLKNEFKITLNNKTVKVKSIASKHFRI